MRFTFEPEATWNNRGPKLVDKARLNTDGTVSFKYDEGTFKYYTDSFGTVIIENDRIFLDSVGEDLKVELKCVT